MPKPAAGTPDVDSRYGAIRVSRQQTLQLKPYTPHMVSVELEGRVEPGETPQDAIERVDAIVREALDARVHQLLDEGFKYDNEIPHCGPKKRVGGVISPG